MVAKISHGASLYGALAYNHEKVLKGSAEILSGHRMISDRPGLPSEDLRLVLLSFENHLIANRRTEKPVLHISLSPAPEDRLDNARLMELAEKYMDKMGYGQQPFIVYRHDDTCNTHVHIVSVCIDDDGRKINDSYEHRRSMVACRELEQEFGLRNGADAERQNPKAELKKVDVSKGDVRHQIGNTLKAVLESYRFQTFGEYAALLSTLNIEARQVRGEYKETAYTGIIYSATDDRGKVVSPPVKSARFGKRFGDAGLSERMMRHVRDFKEGKWGPAIAGKVVRAMRDARSEQEFKELLKQGQLDVVFRKTTQDASMALLSWTMTDAKCSTVHGWEKNFLPMYSTTWPNGGTVFPGKKKSHSADRSFGNNTVTLWRMAVRLNRRQASSLWIPIRPSITRKKRSAVA